MHASVIIGIVICLGVLFIVGKLLYNLVTNSHFLKYEFPEGWAKKIKQRYEIFNKLSESDQNEVGKKTQILVAQKKVKGLEGLEVKIDLRLALAFEMSLLNQQRKSSNLYSKIDPISVLPYEEYPNFKDRGSFTLYWDNINMKTFLETPENTLLESSYYIWLKADKRFKDFSDEELLTAHRDLVNSQWPVSNKDIQSILNNNFSTDE